jgi:hypothetical protein
MATILIQWLVTSAFMVLHPFFVSVTQIEHNEKEKTLEISVRIYTDDLEKTLRPYSKTKVDLIKPADKEALNKLITAYMQQHLKLVVNGKPVQLEYVGYEIQSESTWTYLQVSNISSVKEIGVNTNILYDLTKDQTNILEVKANNKKSSYKLDYPGTSTSFNF